MNAKKADGFQFGHANATDWFDIELGCCLIKIENLLNLTQLSKLNVLFTSQASFDVNTKGCLVVNYLQTKVIKATSRHRQTPWTSSTLLESFMARLKQMFLVFISSSSKKSLSSIGSFSFSQKLPQRYIVAWCEDLSEIMKERASHEIYL